MISKIIFNIYIIWRSCCVLCLILSDTLFCHRKTWFCENIRFHRSLVFSFFEAKRGRHRNKLVKFIGDHGQNETNSAFMPFCQSTMPINQGNKTRRMAYNFGIHLLILWCQVMRRERLHNENPATCVGNSVFKFETHSSPFLIILNKVKILFVL